MGLLLIPLVAFAVGIGTPAQRPPVTAQRKVIATPKTTTQQFSLTNVGLVTATYLRQHYPDALIGVAHGIKQGKLPSNALAHLASAGVTQSLLTATSLVAQVTKPSRQAPTSGRAPGAWSAVLGAHSILLNQVDYSPQTLVFPGSWDKQTVTTTLHVTSLTDGPVTAALGPNSPFTIKSLTTFDGFVSVNKTTLMRKVAAQITHAPWTIETNAGQDVDITLQFSPHFDLFNFTAGLYKDSLSVKGSYWNPSDPKEKPWSIKVPVSGMFNGIALDVIALADEWHPELVTDASYDPKVPQILPLGFHLINTNATVTGTLSGDGLPAGVTCQPVNVTIGAGQTQAVTLNLSIDRNSSFYLTAPREVPIALNFKFQHGSKTIPIHLDLTIYEGVHTWFLHGSCGGVDFSATMIFYASGYFSFSANGFNNDLIFPVTCAMLGNFPGSPPVINLAFNISNDSNGSDYYGFTNPAIAANYLTWINQPFSLKVTVTTH